MPSFTFSPATRRWLPLVFLCLLLLPLKLITLPSRSGPFLVDGSYYYQIARHVAAGDGLVTSVSLYHEGLDPLPAPARIYPLWPLVLGLTGRGVGILNAARFLPTLLFFLNLALLYALALRLLTGVGRGSPVSERWSIAASLLLVAAFSGSFPFWFMTSEPYTEGLAFALAFASLLALDRAALQASAAWGAASGALVSLAYLARSQMMILALAAGFLLIVWAVRIRPLGRTAMSFAAAAGLVVVPWKVYLASHPVERADIGRFVTWVESNSIGAYIADRAPGLLVAFDPRSQLSYFNSFGAAVTLIPLALLVGAWRARSGRSLPPIRADQLVPLVAVLAGVLNHFALIHRHAQLLLPWLFGWRHGLLLIFPLAIAALYLLARRSLPIRACAALLLLVSAGVGWSRILAAPPVSRGQSPAEQMLIAWIDTQIPPPVVLTTRAQQLGMLTRGRFHWTECGEPPGQTRMMLERLPISHVVLYERDRPCAFVSGLQDVLEVDRRFGRKGEERILLLRRKQEGAGTK